MTNGVDERDKNSRHGIGNQGGRRNRARVIQLKNYSPGKFYRPVGRAHFATAKRAPSPFLLVSFSLFFDFDASIRIKRMSFGYNVDIFFRHHDTLLSPFLLIQPKQFISTVGKVTRLFRPRILVIFAAGISR